MPNLSVAGTGMYVIAVEFVLHLLNLTPPEGSVAAFVNAVFTIAAFGFWAYGQLRRKDLHLGLVRK
mgnify:CR=1 FL=1